MKKFLAVTLILALVFTMAACGGKDATVSEVQVQNEASTEKKAETGIKEYETVAVGNKIATDFIEMTISEAGMADSLETSIKSGYITYTFGPGSSAETDYAYIKGTIVNKSTSNIRNEIVANAKVGDYTLEEDGLTIYKSDGETVYDLSPLVEYNFMMYVEIPNALVERKETCNFNFGFKEGMESASFEEFSELDYKYCLQIAQEAAPAPETAE